MKKISLTYLFLLLTWFAFAQTLKDAEHFTEIGKHLEAIKVYEQVLKMKLNPTQQVAVNKNIMLNYMALFAYDKAFEVYKQNELEKHLSVFSKSEVEELFHLLRVEQKYKEAEKLIPYLKLNEIEQELWRTNYIDYPMLNSNVKINTIKKTNLIEYGQGYGHTFYKQGVLVAEQEQEKTLPSSIYYFKQINDTTFAKKEEVTNSKERFYKGTPFYDAKNNKVYYSASISEHNRYRTKQQEKYKIPANGQNTLQLFVLDLKNQETKHIPLVPYEYNVLTPFLYRDTLLFFSTDINSKNKLDIYYTILQNNTWSKPIPLEIANTQEQDLYPYINGNSFYFSSRGHQNYGGLDVFESQISFKNGKPILTKVNNIGKNINTSYDDFGLIINHQKKTYFVSNRAGKDAIYFTTYTKYITITGVIETSKPIKNLSIERIDGNGEEEISLDLKNKTWTMRINELDTAQLKIKGYGFYTKLLQIAAPSPDSVYTIKLRNKKTDFVLKDKITETPIENALLTISEKKDTNWMEVYKTTTNEDGEWSFDFDVERRYKVTVEAKNYEKKEIYLPKHSREFDNDAYDDFLNSRTFDFEEPNFNFEVNELQGGIKDIDFEFEMPEFELSRKAEGTITINNIYFEHNSAEISTESKQILDNLAQFLKQNKNKKVELSAHTDCIGSDSYNLKLSHKRAINCKKYLISKGIEETQVIAIGKGEKELLNPCKEQRKDDGKAKINRRIEVKFK